jgi:hypothetical protein
VRSALYTDSIGVDYGDVVLFDGAPIMHQTYGDDRIPVFPHLATLVRSQYLIVPFAGTQAKAGAIAELSRRLPEDSVLYSHTEQMALLCRACWERGATGHAHAKTEHHVVRGKLCAPPSVDPARLRDALDEAVASAGGIRLFAPALSARIGDVSRAAIEARRMAMLESGG